MSDTTVQAPADRPRSSDIGPVGRFLNATELDTRMLGMIGALLVIWLTFNFLSGGLFLTPRNLWNLSVQSASVAVMATGMVLVSVTRNIDLSVGSILGVVGMIGALLVIWLTFKFLSGGLFLTPRNLWNLSVQSASVAVMATGMVLVIVTRNIDLSVGSILGVVGMIMGVTQAQILPGYLGFGHPAIWAIAALVGLCVGVAIGALHGYVIAYLGVPAFIVTLGGLLVWRGAAWWVTSGQTVAPMDATFRLMGGGPDGSVGATWSWIIGLAACLAVVAMLANARAQRKRFRF